jgi:hypothetical protein
MSRTAACTCPAGVARRRREQVDAQLGCRSGRPSSLSNSSSMRTKSRPWRPQLASSGWLCACSSSIGSAARSRRRALLALVRRAQQFAPFDDVAPVELAGIRHGQQHLRVARQRGHRLQGLVRQGRHAEQDHAARQALPGGGLPRPRPRTAGGWPRGPDRAARRQAVVDLAPELGLPALVGRQRQRLAAARRSWSRHRFPSRSASRRGRPGTGRTGRPGVRPAAGGAPGRRRPGSGAAARIFPSCSSVGSRRIRRQVSGILVEGRAVRHPLASQHAAVGFPQEARRQRHAGGGAHAQLLGQRDFQPFGHAVRLHQDGFLLERAERQACRAASRRRRRAAFPSGCRAKYPQQAGGDRAA